MKENNNKNIKLYYITNIIGSIFLILLIILKNFLKYDYILLIAKFNKSICIFYLLLIIYELKTIYKK